MPTQPPFPTRTRRRATLPSPPRPPQLQFHLRGPGGGALVNADMYRGEGGEWAYTYLVADVASGGGPPQRLNIIV